MVMWITLEACGSMGTDDRCCSGDCLQNNIACEGGGGGGFVKTVMQYFSRPSGRGLYK